MCVGGGGKLGKGVIKRGDGVYKALSWDGSLTHRVISDKVHRLLVTLSYFRPDRFVQLFSLKPILILLLYLLVSIDLEYTICYESVSWRKQQGCKLNSKCSGGEITSNFSTYK